MKIINTEHPILFNRRVMQNYLAGRKTETRRFPLHQPEELGTGAWQLGSSIFVGYDQMIQIVPQIRSCSRYGIAGDHLYIRETWRADDYDSQITICQADYSDQLIKGTAGIVRWKPSIHMPKDRSRFMIPILRKRFERIRDISDADAIAEGYMDIPESLPPRMAFHNSWNSIYAGDRELCWEANPFVEVIEFPAHKG